MIDAVSYAPESILIGNNHSCATAIVGASNILCLVFFLHFICRWRYDEFEQTHPGKPYVWRKIGALIIFLYLARFVVLINILRSTDPLYGSVAVSPDLHIETDLMLPIFSVLPMMLLMVMIGRALGRRRL